MKIEITANMKAMARRLESAAKENTFGSKILKEAHRHYVGAIGELVFLRALLIMKKWAYYKPSVTSADDGCDVTMHSKGSMIMVDVKTASQPGYKLFLVDKIQFKPGKIYVAVKMLNDDLAEIMGYAYSADLYEMKQEDYNTKILNMGCYYTEMRPIEELFATLDDGDIELDWTNLTERELNHGRAI